MPRNSNAMDMLQQLLPQLTDDEKDELRWHLGNQDPCRKNGHDFKPLRTIPQWFAKPKCEMYCRRCGETIIK